MLLSCPSFCCCFAAAAVALMGEHSLVLVQEPRHKYLRGLLQPAFSGSAISGYLPAIQALVGRHLAEWEAAGEAGVQGYDGLKLLTYEFIISVRVVCLQFTCGLLPWCAGCVVLWHALVNLRGAQQWRACRTCVQMRVCVMLQATAAVC